MAADGHLGWVEKLGTGHFSGNLLLSKDQVRAVDLQSGKTLWQVPLKATFFGPELSGDTILVGDEAGLHGLAKTDGKSLWTLPTAGKSATLLKDGAVLVQSQDGLLLARQGVLAWLLTTGKNAGPPQLSPDQNRLAQVVANPSRLQVVDLQSGQVVQQIPLPEGKAETPQWGPDPETLVHQSRGDVLVTALGQLPSELPILKLDGRRLYAANATRTPDTPWQPLPGEPVYTDDNLVFCKLSRMVPQLDPQGRQVYDLLSGKPLQRTQEGHAILKLPGLEVVESEPDSALVGQPRKVKDRLIYATQEKPPQAPGQKAPPLPDPVLRAVGGWRWQMPFQPDWSVEDENIILRVGDTLVCLDPQTGQTSWTSPRLQLGEGAPSIAGGLVQTDSGLVYKLENGRPVARLDLREGFLWDRLHHLICLGALSLAIGTFILAARRRDLFIRRLAGISAIDEAVGRATEMGKPVLYIPGLEDIDETQTMASLSILSHVARRTAEYDSSILVPTRRSVVMSTAQEVVKDAYTLAGRPDSYVSDNIRYLTDDQFGYVVGVDGMMLRERPAANFYLGYFYSESLILAETGYGTGAIQIAGTAVASQLPFFVVACDYTLIGEELYAASAYLSRDPMQVGSLRGQDAGKALVMLAILLGSLLLSGGYDFVKVWFHA